ncbi:uncharacterized protein NECHADRAFT_89207 [Fusarium vanettenii 77-13-4]|uniref:Uncharacterized protein n=1 Tax=Fusarium vanettenii (strain ATCC MYA-4622 / CBS 123669 / FGSC 9596 / NRRL 45880 / 77-13-4) TaxID=660122 RepID=C7ZQI1_FUSV7|nr:uncharacterized protein NECHADRAFT_89207 [Fusarium vanettenii 77-13-4]EEU33719.1 predicted protein [Fusarium vanettenii 77-13-4]
MSSDNSDLARLSQTLNIDLDTPAMRARDLTVDLLEPCTPEAYRQAVHYQITEIVKINRPKKIPKPGNQWYLQEMEVQHDKYTLWTQLQDEQAEEFWWFLPWLFGQEAPRDWERFFVWFQQKLTEPVANLAAVRALLAMAKELVFVTLMNAKHRNIYLERYPFAYDTIEDRYTHELWVAEARQRAAN